MSLKAQEFDTSTKLASLGIGVGSSLGGFTYSSQIPAISLMYEQGIAEAGNVGVIGIGGYLGFKNYTYKNSSFNSKWNYTIIGARGTLHFTSLDVEKLDLYAGAMISYNMLNYSYTDNTGATINDSDLYSNDLGLSLFGGARYYFNDNLAAFGEIGYGISYLNLGLTLRF